MLRKIKTWFGVLVLVGIICGGYWLFAQDKPQGKKKPADVRPVLNFTVRVGEEESVIQHGAYGLKHFPDAAVAALKKGGRYYWWFSDATEETNTYRFVSDFFDSMQPDPADEDGTPIPVLKPEAGSFDNGGVGITSVFFDEKSGKLYAWYQAQDIKFPLRVLERPKAKIFGEIEEETPHSYVSIGAVVSKDMGKTFDKLGLVVRAKTSKFDIIEDPSRTGLDVGVPAVVRKDRFLYMYYGDTDVALGILGLAVARLAISDLDKQPQPWKKYYKGTFSEAGIGGNFTPVLKDAGYCTVSYNSYLKQWIVVYNPLDEEGFDDVTRLVLRASLDGFKWSEPIPLFESAKVETWYVHPSILDDNGDPRVTDDQFWIYYAYVSNAKGSELEEKGFRMMRRKITLKNRGCCEDLED